MLGVLTVCIEELRRQLHKRGTRTGLGKEVLADQRTEERVEMRFLRFRKRIHKFPLLPIQQPAELFWTLGDSHGECTEALAREERDHLGPKDRRIFGIG